MKSEKPKKLARNSFNNPYECKKDWPEDCFVQCGDSGIVFEKNQFNQVMNGEGTLADSLDMLDTVIDKEKKEDGFYRTAFFEAFPHTEKVDTFLRGEGKSIEEAEEDAWKQYQNFENCLKHEFDRRDRTGGEAWCIHCNMFKSEAFEPLTKCCICQLPTTQASDIEKNYYCPEHEKLMPLELQHDWQKDWNKDRIFAPFTKEQIDLLKKCQEAKIIFSKCCKKSGEKDHNKENIFLIVEKDYLICPICSRKEFYASKDMLKIPSFEAIQRCDPERQIELKKIYNL